MEVFSCCLSAAENPCKLLDLALPGEREHLSEDTGGTHSARKVNPRSVGDPRIPSVDSFRDHAQSQNGQDHPSVAVTPSRILPPTGSAGFPSHVGNSRN